MLGEKMKRVNVTLNQSLLKEVDKVAKMRLEDRSTVVRQLLLRSIKEEKIERAVEMYQKQKITLRQAAKLSGLGYWEFQSEMARRGFALISSLPLVEQRTKYVEDKVKT